MGNIMAVCIVGIVVWGIYRLFELYARRKERLLIIEKLGERFKAEDVKGAFDFPLFPKARSSSFSSLKFALLMIGIGLGLITSFLLQYHLLGTTTYNHEDWVLRNNITELKLILNFSGITIFGGLGLLIAYFIEARKIKG